MEPEYDLEIEKIVEKINQTKPARVLLQLSDGLKQEAAELAKQIENKTSAKLAVWAGTNFGSCDIPNVKDFDLIINFGHSE